MSAIWKCMSEIWGIPSRTNWGPKIIFLTTSQLNGNFNGLCLRKETLYKQAGKCVGNYKGLLHRLKTAWTLVHKRFQIGREFSRLPYVNSAFSFIARLHGRRSAEIWMKRDIDNWARTLGSTKGLPHCPKISWTLVHKRLKTGSDLFTHFTILFRLSQSHAFYKQH